MALAIDGGEPVRATPLPAHHLFGEEEKAVAVALFDAAIESGGVIGYGGPEVRSSAPGTPRHTQAQTD